MTVPRGYGGGMRYPKVLPKTAGAGLVAVGCTASLLVGCSSEDDAGQGRVTEATVIDTVPQPPSTDPQSPESLTSSESTPGNQPAQNERAETLVLR